MEQNNIKTSFCISGGPPTLEERRAYEDAKLQAWLESLNDPEKQKPMLVKGITPFKSMMVGLCPRCSHCLIKPECRCDECYQKVTWEEEKDESVTSELLLGEQGPTE